VEGYTTYKDKNDPIGSGWSGWHNEGKTDPASPPTFYWAIIKTTGLDPFELSYEGKRFPPTATVELFLAGLTSRSAPLAVGTATADKDGNFSGVYSFLCGSSLPSPNAILQALDWPSHYLIVSWTNCANSRTDEVVR
jgi:hypothetical protein